jgi:cytochrome b subunit of formate dehydrogenase
MMRTILKFDTGKNGFEKMILLLAAMAVVVLLCGGIFLWITFGE